jgi:hypothetical protein
MSVRWSPWRRALPLLLLGAVALLTSAFGFCEDDDPLVDRLIANDDFIYSGSCLPRTPKVSHGTPVKFTLKGGNPQTPHEIYRIEVGKGDARQDYDVDSARAERGIEVSLDGDTLTLTTKEDGPSRTERVEIWVALDTEIRSQFTGNPNKPLEVSEEFIPVGPVCEADIVHSDQVQSVAPSPTPAPTATVVSAPPPASQPTPTLESYPRQVKIGETIAFTGEGFTANCPIINTFTPPGSTPFSIETTSDASGVVTATLEITPGQPAGPWTATATDQTTGSSATTTFTVLP